MVPAENHCSRGILLSFYVLHDNYVFLAKCIKKKATFLLKWYLKVEEQESPGEELLGGSAQTSGLSLPPNPLHPGLCLADAHVLLGTWTFPPER